MYALFDLDDTVHDKTSSLMGCANSMYEKFLTSADADSTSFSHFFVEQNCIIQPKVDVFSKIAKKYTLSSTTQTRMLEYFDSSFHKFSKRFEGVLEAFEFLKSQGVKIACVTNGRDFFQRNKIKALGLQEYFDVIVTSGELGVKKPDLIIFKTALRKLNADETMCVFIGDNLKADMTPASLLGMKTIWKAKRSYDVPDSVDYVLTTFSEFPDIWNAITNV